MAPRRMDPDLVLCAHIAWLHGATKPRFPIRHPPVRLVAKIGMKRSPHHWRWRLDRYLVDHGMQDLSERKATAIAQIANPQRE